ncbi:MAG: hypothetical protein ACYDGY_07005 [Acidimicrobiales bacterium]
MQDIEVSSMYGGRGPYEVHEEPFHSNRSPPLVASELPLLPDAIQKVELVQEIAEMPPVGGEESEPSMLLGNVHELPFQVTILPTASPAAQKLVVGQEMAVIGFPVDEVSETSGGLQVGGELASATGSYTASTPTGRANIAARRA